jgi:mRNA interferase MazF
MKNMEIKKGDVVYVQLRPGIGSEQKGKTPAVVVQNNKGNKLSPTTIVAVIGNDKKDYPFHFYFKEEEAGVKKGSAVLCEQLLTIDKKRITKKLGTLSEKSINILNKKLKIELDL